MNGNADAGDDPVTVLSLPNRENRPRFFVFGSSSLISANWSMVCSSIRTGRESLELSKLGRVRNSTLGLDRESSELLKVSDTGERADMSCWRHVDVSISGMATQIKAECLQMSDGKIRMTPER